MKLIIIRVSECQHGTWGVLLDWDFMRNSSTPFAVTLEPRWRNNAKNISCIPAGKYTCRRIISPKFGNTFEIVDVPDRTHILFHKVNKQSDTLGCIGVAEEYGTLDGIPAILQSGKGFKEFLDKTKGVSEFDLEIYQTLLKPGYSRLSK